MSPRKNDQLRFDLPSLLKTTDYRELSAVLQVLFAKSLPDGSEAGFKTEKVLTAGVQGNFNNCFSRL